MRHRPRRGIQAGAHRPAVHSAGAGPLPIAWPLETTPVVTVYVDAGYVLALATQRNHTSLAACVVDGARMVATIRDAVARHLEPLLPGARIELRWYDAADPTQRVDTHWVRPFEALPDVTARLGRVLTQHDGRMVQKRVDTLLVADLVEAPYAPRRPDAIVVMTGDDDITPGVVVARRLGIPVHLCAVADRGQALGVSRHLQEEVDDQLAIEISGLAVAVRSRQRIIAQMAALIPRADVDTEPDRRSETPTPSAVVAEWQPLLPGMPDPAGDAAHAARRAGADCEGLPAATATRSELAGQAFAGRWWIHTSPAERERAVSELQAGPRHVPQRVDQELLEFTAEAIRRPRLNEACRHEARAGFTAAIMELATPGLGQAA